MKFNELIIPSHLLYYSNIIKKIAKNKRIYFLPSRYHFGYKPNITKLALRNGLAIARHPRGCQPRNLGTSRIETDIEKPVTGAETTNAEVTKGSYYPEATDTRIKREESFTNIPREYIVYSIYIDIDGHGNPFFAFNIDIARNRFSGMYGCSLQISLLFGITFRQ